MTIENRRISRRRSGSSALTMRLLSRCLVKKTSGVGPRRARFCRSNSSRLRAARSSILVWVAPPIIEKPAVIAAIFLPPACSFIPAASFSAALNFALRDLGLRSISCSSAITGFLVKISKLFSSLNALKASLTRRSSSEWKLIRTSRPPGLSRDPALASSDRISPNSSFTRIRIA